MQLHLPPDLESRYIELSEYTGRHTDELLFEALERYVHDRQRFRDAVQEGIDAAHRGEFVEHEEVEAWLEAQKARESA